MKGKISILFRFSVNPIGFIFQRGTRLPFFKSRKEPPHRRICTHRGSRRASPIWNRGYIGGKGSSDRKPILTQKRRRSPWHDKQGFSAAVKVADKAELKRGQNTIDGICPQIISRRGNHRRLAFVDKQGGQRLALGKTKDTPSTSPLPRRIVSQTAALSPRGPALRAYVLGDKRRHRLPAKAEGTSIMNMQSFPLPLPRRRPPAPGNLRAIITRKEIFTNKS